LRSKTLIFSKVKNIKIDIDWKNLKKENFLFIPKADSKKEPLYFDKKRIYSHPSEQHVTFDDCVKLLGGDQSENPIKRDDLLHKTNILYFNEKFKKLRKFNFNEMLSLSCMLEDLNIGDES
jgi:hypothetical protein